VAAILTILKMEKDNELILLWTSGLNKMHIVNLIFRISLLIMLLQHLMASIINPETLNVSRNLLKNSELQFVPSLLKEKKFNDTVDGLTVFVDKKNKNGIYENIFIRDEGRILTKISDVSATIFAKTGYVTKDEKSLVLTNGNIQKLERGKEVNVIKFEKTVINLSGLSTKTISEPKIQETSTLEIIKCMQNKNKHLHNCSRHEKNLRDTKAEINRRFGMPIFIPLIALISCFVLRSARSRESKFSNYYHFFIGFIGFSLLIASEISVRYSGVSWNHTAFYYLIPFILIPMVYLFLIRTFKYENLG
tara:strand:- start:3070 stop:3987 length:918 start_codon:yes stop_codon:yes gene_type:complete